MMIGIDRKRHEALQERIEHLEQLSVYSKDSELRTKQKELEKQISILSEQLTHYDALIQQLATVVESYSKLYNETSSDAYRILRKARAKKRA